MSQKTFIVLGMHRSATSLVAKGINSIVHLGEDFLPANQDNPEGYYENKAFVYLNERILASAGGTWRYPPSEAKIMAQQEKYADEIRATIEKESKGKKLWGWKDPRSTLTIKLFMPYIINPHFICCFRDPLEVANSLYKREDIPFDEGLNLAHLYNLRMLSFLNDYYLKQDPVKRTAQNAGLFLNEQKYAEAEKKYSILSEYEQTNATYLHNLGLAKYQLGKYEEALDIFAEELEISEVTPELCHYIADCARHSGDEETARLYEEKKRELKQDS